MAYGPGSLVLACEARHRPFTGATTRGKLIFTTTLSRMARIGAALDRATEREGDQVSTETEAQHPQASEALEQLKKLTTLLEDQMAASDGGSFTAKDESRTVTATINGHRLLTRLSIEEGLLRLGAATVQERVNEAIGNAQEQATAAIAGQQQNMVASLLEMTASLAKSVGLSL